MMRAVASISRVGTSGRAPAGIQTLVDPRSRDLLVLVLVGVALALVDLASPALPGGGAFLLLLVPVVACTVVLGPRRGVMALVLGAAGAVALVPIRGHPWLSDPADVARLALYLAVGAGTILAIGLIPRERHGPPPAPRVPLPRPARSGATEPLTLRELDVLRLAARGSSIADIADRLYVSRNTVKSHLSHAYGKLGVHNRAQAIAAGLTEGLLDADSLCGDG